ncbi:hypothetical protein MKX01_016938 [Papaver californicum]|nr:hypothetical protein MKX01_016938 [Papaver californicum]
MGVLFNGAQRSDLKPGDHIYTWRVVYAYSHHGIYMGGDKVVHFTQEQDESSGIGASLNTSTPSSSVPSKLKLPNPSASTSNFSANLKLPNPSASTSNFLPNLKLPNPSSSTLNFPSNLSSFDSSGSGSNVSSLNSFGSGSNLTSSCSNFPDCGFKNPNSGSLYLFEYGVTPSIFFAKVRGGTCTTANSDPTDMVIHRAMYLLQKGFGNYDIFLNNCEDFALYCKTGLLTLDKSGVGRSGQAASVVGAPLAAILATPPRFLMPAPVGMAVTAGMYCVSRYATDIGVRSDVIKVAVEDMSVDLGWVRNPGKEAAEEDEEVSSSSSKTKKSS